MKDRKRQVRGIDFRYPEIAGKELGYLKPSRNDLGPAVGIAYEGSRRNALTLARGILQTAADSEEYVSVTKALVSWARASGKKEQKLVSEAVMREAGDAGGLLVVGEIAQMTQSDARAFMKSYLSAGGTTLPIALWLRSAGEVLNRHDVKASGTAGVVVDALGEAGQFVVDALEEGVDAVLESIEAIVDAIADAGLTVVSLLAKTASWTVGELGDLFRALIEAGTAVAEFVAGAVVATYRTASRYVQALLLAGVLAVDILTEVVGAGYYRFRRIVYGLVEALGPIGDVLQAVAALAAGAADELWRRGLLAIRYAKNRLEGVVDWFAGGLEWALEQGAAAIEAVVRAWEEIGEALVDLYEAAAELAVKVWDFIGEATVRIGNSIGYAWQFLSTSFVPGIFDFVRGAVRAGFGVARIVAAAVKGAFEVLLEAVRALRDIGTTIGVLIADTVANPGNFLPNVLRAMKDIGDSLEDFYQAAIVETAEEFMEEVTRALVEIGEGIVDILVAVASVVSGAVGTTIGILFSLLGTYRTLTEDEIADARTVFEEAIDYSKVRVSTEGVLNDIVFGVQDFVTGNPDSRAFVTNTLINFDPGDGGLERHTLVHELTHVWQFLTAGPEYLIQAVGAQAVEGDAAYNYGYDEGLTELEVPTDHEGDTGEFDAGYVAGLGGDDELNAANGDFGAFNRERQGQIMMHYFVRDQFLGEGTDIVALDGTTVLDTVDLAPWQPYVDFVRATA